jgi:diguanylate cyclase
MALSVILTTLILDQFSGGVDLPGLAVAIFTPALLAGPLLWFLMLRHEQLAHANAQLEYMATTDWLTACLNRGAFTGAATRHLDKLVPLDFGGALLIIDADGFKAVNDRFGHEVGDQALQLIAQAIRASVDSTALVGRLGGEEFGVFLARAAQGQSDNVAESIRRSVSSINFAPDDVPCPLSVSIGGATFSSHTNFETLYRVADSNLYQAKHAGRDRVSLVKAA